MKELFSFFKEVSFQRSLLRGFFSEVSFYYKANAHLYDMRDFCANLVYECAHNKFQGKTLTKIEFVVCYFCLLKHGFETSMNFLLIHWKNALEDK